jgi:tetratricopeptide (TPR) repeat protein
VDGCGFRPERFRIHQKHDPLFASVLTHPANLSNTIQYAVTAASHGDIESAISAYEQLRFYDPKLAATRFQLGVLYYQLGYAQARGYLQTALAMPDPYAGVSPEDRGSARNRR